MRSVWISTATAALLGTTATAQVAPTVTTPPTATVKPMVTPAATPTTPAVAAAIREMTDSESAAHALWNFRAALNVAALQCQFSPFLQTVRNYNELLRHHDVELDRARRTLAEHFRRHDKAAGTKTFDQYTTRTYNAYSTLDAQISFCDAGSLLGREALFLPKGRLSSLAGERLPAIRTSLTAVANPLYTWSLGWVSVPTFVDPCLDKKGRRKKRC